MAISFGDLADLHVSAALSGQVLLALAARGSLPMHPALLFGGDTRRRGTNTLLFPQIGLMGYDLLGDVAEGAGGVPTAITDAVSSLTPRRKFKAYDPTDVAKWTDATGMINRETFARDAVATYQATQLALLSAMGPSFTASAGSTGVDLAASTHLGARIALEMANVPGPYLAVYHSRQIGDLAEDAEATAAGAFQWSDDAQRVMKQDGFAGNFLGVDIYRSNHVPADAGNNNRTGLMFGPGAIVWGILSVEAEGSDQVSLADLILFERQRFADKGVTSYVQTAYLDFQLAIDAAGTEVLSDF